MHLTLPEENVIEVAKELRRRDPNHDVFLVAMITEKDGHKSEAYRELAMRAGFDLVTYKPLAWKTVLDVFEQERSRRSA